MILNRQRRVRVSVRSLEAFLARVRRRLHLPPEAVSIALVTDAQISRWNRLYRGKPRPTDVLSFPVSEWNADHPSPGKFKSKRGMLRSISYLGDIAIAPAVARRNARLFHRAFSQEMKILILHGILHVLGYDHETDSGQMDRFERRLRRELGLS
ncbi:MAG TPA: rRNA maturation RNase YbeY [Verrucomicrobiae bacterium]|nr:rRNA maturation RNase YbeY [Verrucomicrobiae bacterium]